MHARGSARTMYRSGRIQEPLPHTNGGTNMGWTRKLERRMGRFRIPDLMKYVVGGMVIVYLLNMLLPGVQIINWITLTRAGLMRLELWRLVTFVFVPPLGNPFFTLISLYFYYMVGNIVESVWGSGRFTLFYLFGILGAILATLVSPSGNGTNAYINSTLFLALATLAPDVKFLLFFIVPVKAKWLALAYLVFSGYGIVRAFLTYVPLGLDGLIQLGVSLLVYILFLGPTLKAIVSTQLMYSRNRRNWQNRNR